MRAARRAQDTEDRVRHSHIRPATGRWLAIIGLAAALAACSATESEGDGAGAAGEPAATGSADAGAAVPDDFVGTAWRAEGRDGARYTTHLDAEGRYRDRRDGAPWHQGTWERAGEDRLCLTPDGDGAAPRCWTIERLDRDGTMTIAGPDGTRVALTEVDYAAPIEGESDGEEAAGASAAR